MWFLSYLSGLAFIFIDYLQSCYGSTWKICENVSSNVAKHVLKVVENAAFLLYPFGRFKDVLFLLRNKIAFERVFKL